MFSTPSLRDGDDDYRFGTCKDAVFAKGGEFLILRVGVVREGRAGAKEISFHGFEASRAFSKLGKV